MYFVSSIHPKVVGVTDTEDGVEEFLNLSDLKQLHKKGVKILGVDLPNKQVKKVDFDMLSTEIRVKYCNQRIREQLEMFKGVSPKMIFDMYEIFCSDEEFCTVEPKYDEIDWSSPEKVKYMGLHWYDWGCYYLDYDKDWFVTCIAVNDNAVGDYIREDLESGEISVLDILRCENEEVIFK